MIYKSELTGKLTRSQLTDVWYKAIKEEQTDVADRVGKLLEENNEAEIFVLEEPQPFLRTIPSGLSGAIDEASEHAHVPGLAKQTLSVSDLYDRINQLVLDSIKEGDLPWTKTWANTDYRLGCSYATGKPYSYANQLLIKSVFGELKNPFFITLAAMKKEGGQLKDDFWFTDIYVIGQLWSFMHKGKREAFYSIAAARDFVDANYGGSKDEKAKRVSDAYRRFLTTEMVVNGDFVEGIDFKLVEKKYIAGARNEENTPLEVAEAIVNNFPTPKIPITQRQQDSAFYKPGDDSITMPLMKDFVDSERYYATLFHEMIHGTGHRSRLNRLKFSFFGDDNYAAEELVAEIGASYLSAEAGILHHHVQNTAAYLKGWHKQLGGAIEEDSTFLLTAMKYAERAAEFVLQRNSSGTPLYIDKLIEKKEKEQEVKEKLNPDLELIQKEIKVLEAAKKKAKPTQKREIQSQLDLFDQFTVLESSKGLKNPNAHREQMMWQTYLLRIKHRRKTSNAKMLIGQANGILKSFIGDKSIYVAKKTIAPVVKKTNSQNTFFQLLNLIELLNDPFAIFETNGGHIVVTEMKDYNAKRYMAAVHIDSKKTAIVQSFDSRINQKDFNAWAFDGQLVYSRKGSNLIKKNGLAGPVEDAVVEVIQKVRKALPKREKNTSANNAMLSPVISGQKTPEVPGKQNTQNPPIQEVTNTENSKFDKFMKKTAENESPEAQNDTFSLRGELGKLLQVLQRFRLAIVLIGESGAGKSEMFSQLINGFLELGDKVAVFDLEHGGTRSKETKASFGRNIPNWEKLEEQGQLYVFGDAPEGIQTIREAAETGHFNTIAIDSWQELDVLSVEFNNLRKDYPEVNFISIFQMVDGKNIRGGNKPVFDAPIRIKCFKGDDEFDFSINYAQVMKNRGNSIGGKYSMFERKMISDANVSQNDTEVSNIVTDVAQNANKLTDNEIISSESWSGSPISLN